MNIGIIGYGNVAAAHLKALELIPAVKQAMIWGRDFSKAKNLAIQFSKAHAIEAFEKFCEQIDAAIICTPNNIHIANVTALNTYKQIPILCEKPPASNIKDAELMQTILPANSAIGFNYRFNPIISTLRNLQAEKSLGTCLAIELTFNKQSALLRKNSTWKDASDQEGSSGALGDLGSHLLDLVNFMSDSTIINSTVKFSLGTKIKTKTGVTVSVDDNCIVTGITTSNTIFKIIASKVADDNDLGIFLHLTFTHGSLHYNTLTPHIIEINFVDTLSKEIFPAPQKKLIADPIGEIPFWSDAFYWQDLAWINSLADKHEPTLASITEGLAIQHLINPS